VCVFRHQAAIGNRVNPADPEDAALHGRQLQHGEQIPEQILDGNRLRRHEYPARRNHHRQSFNQGSDHLKGKAADLIGMARTR
jgi:hypothetical protein